MADRTEQIATKTRELNIARPTDIIRFASPELKHGGTYIDWIRFISNLLNVSPPHNYVDTLAFASPIYTNIIVETAFDCVANDELWDLLFVFGGNQTVLNAIG
jgi:hypothetical protein